MDNTSIVEEHFSKSLNATTAVYFYTNEEILELIYAHIQLRRFQWIYVGLFASMFGIGIAGNVLVCYSVLSSNTMKVALNYFLVNLSIADILVLVICLPATLSSDILQSWFLGEAMCKITTYLQVREITFLQFS